MNCVDVHAHYCPIEFYQKLESRKSIPYVRRQDEGAWLFKYGKDQSSSVRSRMYSLEHRLGEMNARGIKTQILSPLLHGIHALPAKLGLDLCRLVNDKVTEVARESKGRFEAFGVLPLQSIDESLKELERIRTLNVMGVVFLSNLAGKFLDEPSLLPVYKALESMNLTVFIHPTHPVNDKGMKDHHLISCLGFLYDTTLAMSRIIFSGLLERFAKLRFILPHVGSLIPYITARMDKEIKRDPEKESMKRAPSEYFKLVHVDTVSLHPPALTLVHSYLGADRILFGCDYPFWGIGEGFDSVQRLDIPAEDKEKIFYRNAEKLFGLIDSHKTTQTAMLL
ncbi:MAG TPA: amidohydrolase family protein [Candidatus Binatia bacterium]|jgi:predicted TIM-barrel fold metal-dependent hydrolase